jgi:hypothetical protein
MLRTLIFALVGAVVSCMGSLAPAQAGYFGSCLGGAGSFNCSVFRSEPSASSGIIHLPTTDENAASTRRRHDWAEACKPTSRTDDLGVERLEYARRGCDVGAPR